MAVSERAVVIGTPQEDGSTIYRGAAYVFDGKVNQSPVLDPIGDRTVDEQCTLNFTAEATDPDQPTQTLTFSLDAAAIALGMSIDASTGEFNWTPNESHGGTSYSATITVIDNGSSPLSDSETISITVNEVNAVPTAEANGPYVGSEGAAVTLTAAGSMDPDGNSLQYRWDFNSDGTWDTGWLSDLTVDHTWSDDWEGTVTVEVSDGELTSTATAAVSILNVAPLAVDDAFAMYGLSLSVSATGVLGNDTDSEQDSLASVLVDEPTGGTVTLQPEGSFVYTIGPGFAGVDTFKYRASDGEALGNLATVTITHQTYVRNTNDSGVGSLRWALNNANAHAGLDTIAFAVPGVGPTPFSRSRHCRRSPTWW